MFVGVLGLLKNSRTPSSVVLWQKLWFKGPKAPKSKDAVLDTCYEKARFGVLAFLTLKKLMHAEINRKTTQNEQTLI